jgi:hypothetical protein
MAQSKGRNRFDRPIAVNGMEIGMANAARLDFDQHLAGSRFGNRDFLDRNGARNACATAAFMVVRIVRFSSTGAGAVPSQTAIGLELRGVDNAPHLQVGGGDA